MISGVSGEYKDRYDVVGGKVTMVKSFSQSEITKPTRDEIKLASKYSGAVWARDRPGPVGSMVWAFPWGMAEQFMNTRDVAGALLPFDVASQESFDSLFKHLSKLPESFAGKPAFVVGITQKTTGERQVKQEDAEKRAKDSGFQYIE